MAAEIQRERGIAPTLVKSSGGVFEVTIDGKLGAGPGAADVAVKLAFSKKAEGRFPDLEEVLALIPAT